MNTPVSAVNQVDAEVDEAYQRLQQSHEMTANQQIHYANLVIGATIVHLLYDIAASLDQPKKLWPAV